MRTLSVSISELEFSKFGLNKEKMSFSDLIDVIGREMTRKNINDSIELAEKYGLSKMTMEEISDEVKAVRDAKGNS